MKFARVFVTICAKLFIFIPFCPDLQGSLRREVLITRPNFREDHDEFQVIKTLKSPTNEIANPANTITKSTKSFPTNFKNPRKVGKTINQHDGK
jgi:hypothetical protein